MTRTSFDRRFSLHGYWVSHGLLLLRSGITNDHTTRIDILFSDVVWMTLPAWMEGLTLEECELSELPFPLPAFIDKEARLRRSYRITTQGVSLYVVGANVQTAEDRQTYFGPSSLLPKSTLPTPLG